MANYESAYRTNHFRVTNESRYEEILENLIGEDIHCETSVKDDGNTYHCICGYGVVDYQISEDEYDLDSLFTNLQKILPDDEAIIFTETGNERLRYVGGYSVVCTKKELVSFELSTLALNKAKELLGDDYTTELYY